MASTDGADSGRTKAQPTRAAGAENQRGETLSGATVGYVGPKQGLPEEFGRDRVRKLLGGGGMGAVYLVWNTELDREEALKVPHFEAADDPQVRERFVREAKAAAGLDHANLCPVYDVGVRDGIYYLTMRYLKGKLLSEYTQEAQPPRKAVEIVTKLAQALAAAHAKGVIHRDLKPNNVMMCPGVGPVVMDFGLAKRSLADNQTLTRTGTTIGTPAYMPPEQVKGELDRLGPASDVYSLGVILFELLTGRPPFTGGSAAEVYGKILYTEAPAPSSQRPGLPAALDAICVKATAKTPEGRYASMKAFAAALIDYLKAAPVAEGAGDLKTAKTGPADIFQVPTVVPKQEEAATPPRRQSSDATVPTVIAAGKSEGDRSRRTLPGWAKGVLLMLGVFGVVGVLFWMISARPHAPSTPPIRVNPLPVAATTPIESSANPSPAPTTHPIEAPLADTITNTIGMKFKLILAGTFKMGSPDSDKEADADEKPQHDVEITRPFYLGVYPLTKDQFGAFINGTNYQTDAEGAGDTKTWRTPKFLSKYDQTDDDPVVAASWNDAVKFCEWLSKKEGKTYELPTEAEWEYACRAGTTTIYSFGDDPKMLGDYAWYNGNSGDHTHPVGGKKPNPWGLYDMSGNVWQWCADGYDKYHEGYIKDQKSKDFRYGCVSHGGSWLTDPSFCRSAHRAAPGPRTT